MISKREQILTALSAFIRQRPGMEYGNYGDAASYRSESRSITRDMHIANRLLAQVSWRESIGEPELREAFRSAYSGRLSIVDRPDGSIALDYCTGQYFPTEYRAAACAVLASALWRARCDQKETMGMEVTGDKLRHYFRREYGSAIANRFFN